jgi:hypothetical protein
MDDVKQELLGLSDYVFQRLTSRVEDLGEEEYWWEPSPDPWSLRQGRDGHLHMQFGLIFDEEPPVTTIAWRLTHIIDLLSEERCATWIGLEPEPENLFADGAPATAAKARDLLAAAGERWRRYVTATDSNALMEKVGPIGRQFADSSRMAFILHIIDELIHHAAEVAVLRDLYRAAQPDRRDSAVATLLTGDAESVAALDSASVDAVRKSHPDLVLTAAATARWDAVPRLVDLGFGIEGRDGRTPLHHAAAAGEVDTIRLLLDRGADPSLRDNVFRATPIEWARFFDRTDAIEVLTAFNGPAGGPPGPGLPGG